MCRTAGTHLRQTCDAGSPTEVSHEVCVHAVGNTSLKAWLGMLLSSDRSSQIEGIGVWGVMGVVGGGGSRGR